VIENCGHTPGKNNLSAIFSRTRTHINQKVSVTNGFLIVFDNEHRRKLAFNILQYDKKVEHGKDQYLNLELAKQRAPT
jgi:hypothetical protein